MVRFVHLHLHSCYSLRDSIIRPDDLIARLKEIGQDAAAITDHGGCLGSVLLYKELKSAGIKFIHGMESYICDDAAVKDKDNRYYHLVLLCKNETGRLNLNRLISISERPENKYYKPRIDFGILKAHSEGLIVLTACLAGEIPRLLQADDYEGAKALVAKYKSVFGEDYYLELQARNDPEQIEINKQILKLAADTNTETVVTCDAHYVEKGDKEYQNKYAFYGAYRESDEGAYLDCYVQSEAEVRANLEYLPQETVDHLISSTHTIADKCNVEIPISAPIMPEVPVPDGYASGKDYLIALCNEGFKTKLNLSEMDDLKIVEYHDRFKYELDSLERMGFIDYILLVHSYANITTRRGIARGSGGGSLICYLTGITQIDPVEHGLYFERFIDVGQLQALESGEISRSELKVPDIDLDFATDTLGDILHFLYERYGEDRVASIGRFGTNKTKGTIRDMCKVLEIGLKDADYIAKAFDSYEIEDIDAMIADEIPTPPGANIAIGCVMRHRELFTYVRKLNNLPKSFGLHPCGKIIAVQDLDNYLPSCYDSDGVRYLQGDMHDTDSLGLVKIDVLGLRTLNQQFDTHEMSGEDDSFLSTKQDMSDQKVMELFRNTDTTGIFQFASRGMQETLRKMQVQSLDDLAIANALFRPGPMQYIDEFCRRRTGHAAFSYTHPDLESILSRTYGIMVFQEQLIQIGRLAGLHNPDMLRKATGKKDIKLMGQVRPELEAGLKARGWNDQQVAQLWRDMIEFSMYAFNKCVSGKTRLLRFGTTKSKENVTVEEMFNLKNDIEYAKKVGRIPLRSKLLRNGYGNALSMCEDGRVRINRIVDITFSGIMPTITIATISGASITCTRNHRIPTPKGDVFAGDLTIGDVVFVKGEYEPTKPNRRLTDSFEPNYPKKGQCGFQKRPNGASVIFEGYKQECKDASLPCEKCGIPFESGVRFEAHHIDGDAKNNCVDNFMWLCNSCHKKKEYRKHGRTKVYEKGVPTIVDKVLSITENAPECVYDIEMAAPAHTFVTESGFVSCNSHSYAYSMLAYLTAKQKAYYPAEFFVGLLNSYIGESSFVKKNADEIVSDIHKHSINILPFDYRQDHRRCSVKDGAILYGIPLIRSCSQAVADQIYYASGMQLSHFWRLLKHLYDNGVNTAQMTILIRLGFFSSFGSEHALARIDGLYSRFYGKKQIDKKQVDGSPIGQIVKKHSSDIGKSGNILKRWNLLDGDAMMDDIEAECLANTDMEFTFKEKADYQKEVLGFVSLMTGKQSDRPILYVKGVYPVKRKKDGVMFGRNIIAQSIGSGITTRYTIFNRVFEKEPLEPGDVIRCLGYERNGKYFDMTKYSRLA